MRITGFELIEIRMALRGAFTSSAGARRERSVLLVRAESAEGEEGWAECVAGDDPSYTAETTETAWHILREFVLPPLVGREVLAPDDVTDSTRWIRGHPMARAAAEMALWDLQAAELSVPLWELLGGSGDPVPVGVSLGIERDPDRLLERVEEHVASGYARIKLKVAPGWDVEVVERVRSRFRDLALMVDANGAYTLDDAPIFEALDDLDLQLVEQPLAPADLLSHARLRERIRTPICLDESISDEHELRTALALGSCDVVSLKAGRVGGLTAARSMLDLCRKEGVGVWCGGMLETGIGRAHALSLATLPGFAYAADLSASARYWDRDIVTPEFTLDAGRLRPHPGAGIGVEPDRDRIRGLARRQTSFGTLRRAVAPGSP